MYICVVHIFTLYNSTSAGNFSPNYQTETLNSLLMCYKHGRKSLCLHCRFLQVLPASAEDEKLLVDILRFLNRLLREQRSSLESGHLKWILKSLLKNVRTYLRSYLQTVRNDRCVNWLTGSFLVSFSRKTTSVNRSKKQQVLWY